MRGGLGGLRHVDHGTEGIVKLGRRGNGVSGESPVLVVGRRRRRCRVSVASCISTTGVGSISGSGGGYAVSISIAAAAAAAPASSSTAAELAQKLVLVLDAPFTPAQLCETIRVVIIVIVKW